MVDGWFIYIRSNMCLGVSHRLEKPTHPLPENRRRESLGIGPTGARIDIGPIQLLDRIHQSIDRLRFTEYASRARHDSFRRATGSVRHDRPPRGLRLDRRDTEILEARKQK